MPQKLGGRWLEVCWLLGLRAAPRQPRPRLRSVACRGAEAVLCEPPCHASCSRLPASRLGWQGSLVRWPRHQTCAPFLDVGAQGEASSSSCYIPSALQAMAEYAFSPGVPAKLAGSDRLHLGPLCP